MKTFTTYILYSATIKRYYIGYTSTSLEERLKKHNTNHHGFTGKCNDWLIVWFSVAGTKSEALRLEKKIKKRGAKRFLQDSENSLN
ncbi:MAG: GIY-YIG nuclease family protein [Bacteroidota bacterium]